MADGILNPIEQLEADFDFDIYTKQEVDALLDEKADKSDTYTKTETDALLDNKADADAVYTKTETDTLLSAKADKSTTLAGYGITDAYTKTQTDNLLNGKADADSVYTKQEIDTKIPSSVGSATKPVYVNGGVVSACTYELNKTVPANAVFTDTTYSAGNGLNLSGTSFSAKAGTNVTVDGNGINVNGSGVVASADSGIINGGTAYTELRPTLDGTWVKNAQTTAINLQKLEGGIEYLYGLLSHQYDQLKKYINGNYYDYQTDSDSKYTKTVLAGAMPYASLDSVGGKTVVWNQITENGNFATTDWWYASSATITANNNVLTTTLTAKNGATQISRAETKCPTVIGHKYYASCEVNPAKATTCRFQYSSVATGISNVDIPANTWTKVANLYTCTNNVGTLLYYNVGTALDIGDTVQFRNYMLFDLTLMFGAGNEPSTVAEFTSQFPAQYYPYNAGTLLSAGVTEVVSRRQNLVNSTMLTNGSYYANGSIAPSTTRVSIGSNYIEVEPSETYTIGSDGTNILVHEVYQFDSNKNIVGSASTIGQAFTNLTVGNTTHYIRYSYRNSGNTTILPSDVVNPCFLKGANANITIATYPIPASIQALEGYGWSTNAVSNHIDYESKKFIKNVASVDLGTLNWVKWTGSQKGFYAQVSGSKGTPNGQKETAICQKYVGDRYSSVVNGTYDKIFNISNNTKYIYLYDSAYQEDTAVNFKASLSGVYLYYELATPIETDISAYLTDDNLIEVEAGGSLTFPNSNGDDYRIAVPSAETYMIDLQASLGE